jgi:hypothetical protein
MLTLLALATAPAIAASACVALTMPRPNGEMPMPLLLCANVKLAMKSRELKIVMIIMFTICKRFCLEGGERSKANEGFGKVA